MVMKLGNCTLVHTIVEVLSDRTELGYSIL
jgi:hypothetical protein